jgi:hypothetical protein
MEARPADLGRCALGAGGAEQVTSIAQAAALRAAAPEHCGINRAGP